MRTTSIAVGVAPIGTCLGLRARDVPSSRQARPGTTESAGGRATMRADDEKAIAALAAA